MSQPTGPADAQWEHDLHDTVVQLKPGSNNLQPVPSQHTLHDFSRPLPFKSQPQNRSFSKTTRIGTVQIRVCLAGMADPINFSTVPVNQHTRLPNHRPPLRRDKPVRVSLPNSSVQYIFPSTERSFIFIPRALRPNQQGFGRARGRGSFGGHSGFGGLSSRRTSAYAGSTYSPSVAMSRRSSLAREVTADALISPVVGSGMHSSGLPIEPGKPRVRLPPQRKKLRFQARTWRQELPWHLSLTFLTQATLSQRSQPSARIDQHQYLCISLDLRRLFQSLISIHRLL